jgi:hypothetical protein
MKYTEKEYRKHVLKETNFISRLLHALKILRVEVFDRKAWNNNNDYYYNIKMVRFNPLSYVVLPILVLFSFFVGGFNKKHFNGVKKELKQIW